MKVFDTSGQFLVTFTGADTLSQAISVLSNQISVLSNSVSVISQQISVLSARVASNSAIGGGGGQTVFRFPPIAATFPTSNFPQLLKNSGTNWTDYTLDFDATSSEAAYWYDAIATSVPSFTSAICELWFRTSSISGTFVADIVTQTRGVGEAWDTASAITNTSSAITVPNVAFNVGIVSVALTVTGWAAGEILQVKIDRNVSADTAAGDIKLIDAIIRLT